MNFLDSNIIIIELPDVPMDSAWFDHKPNITRIHLVRTVLQVALASQF